MESTASNVTHGVRVVGNLCRFVASGEVMTRRYLVRVTGFIITLTLLLAVVVGLTQAHQARSGQSEAAPVSSDDTAQVEDTALVCLALVGGTALLAGAVWMSKLRCML